MKKERFGFIFVVGISLSVSSCVGSSSARPRSASVSTVATITVTCRDYDRLGLREEIEHKLVRRGYNVVSDDVARRSVVTQFDVRRNQDGLSGRLETFGEKKMRSVYALSFSYTTYLDGNLKTLNGSLVDLSSGRVVRSMRVQRFGWSLVGYENYIEEFLDQI